MILTNYPVIQAGSFMGKTVMALFFLGMASIHLWATQVNQPTDHKITQRTPARQERLEGKTGLS